MTTYLPTLKQLQYLVALKDHGHFGRAAEMCFVTQSTMSAGIRELETLIGVTLVERPPPGLRPVPPAGRPHRAQAPPRAARGGRARRPCPRRRAAAVGRDADERH